MHLLIEWVKKDPINRSFEVSYNKSYDYTKPIHITLREYEQKRFLTRTVDEITLFSQLSVDLFFETLISEMIKELECPTKPIR